MRIIIAGGGRIAYFLARRFLSKGHTVAVINADHQECRWLARQLKAIVIEGDGSLPHVLEEAGGHEADVVLAATDRDEDNLVICQIAQRHFHVPSTLALVSDPDNEEVFPKLGVARVVSMTKILSTLIEEHASVDEIMNLTALAQGNVNVTEIKLTDDCPVLGRPLAEIGLPDESLIACILRGEAVIVPHGRSQLAAGDRVVLITVPSIHGTAVKSLTGEE